SHALRPSGLGMSDWFTADGDDTAAALALLLATGRLADPSILLYFAHADHFRAYASELQPSLSVTAHAVHALRLAGRPCDAAQRYILQRQLADGRWPGDKWHSSWLYTTSQAVIALADSPHADVLSRAADALLSHQHPGGGWGDDDASAEGTAYGVLALRALVRAKPAPCLQQGLDRAERWLLECYRPLEHAGDTACWLGKQNYLPRRIVRLLQLTATVPTTALPASPQLSQLIGGPGPLRYPAQQASELALG